MITQPNYNNICDPNSLYESFKKCRKSSGWKVSTQRYELNLLRNIRKSELQLKNQSYCPSEPNKFITLERGKERLISSDKFEDVVVTRCLCDELNSLLSSKFIYDNGATQKKKGISFAHKRFKKHIRSFYSKNGRDGYILFIDFKKFFDNIDHNILLNKYKEIIQDSKIINLIQILLDSFNVLSVSDDGEIFNAVENFKSTKPKLYLLFKSMNIGNHLSQISGLFLPTEIDNFCKIVEQLKYYGRYMDDIYVVHKDKEYLHNLVHTVYLICSKLGIHVNERKTKVVKLTRPFTFLKVRYRLTETGKLIAKISKIIIHRERNKLKHFKEILDIDLSNWNEYLIQFKSWKNNYIKYNNYHSFIDLDHYANQIFSTTKCLGGI